MDLAEVTLVTREIEPGWSFVSDDVPIGKTYIVDLDSIAGMRFVNEANGRTKDLAAVLVVSPGPPGYFPAIAFGMTDLPGTGVTFQALPEARVEALCLRGAGAVTCSYLCKQNKSYFCGKGTSLEALLTSKRTLGQIRAMGDNCSGPPFFTPQGVRYAS